MMAILALGFALAFVVAALVALLAITGVRSARRRARAACLALAAAHTRAADEEARAESALRLLEEMRQARLAEFQQYAARLQILQAEYAQALAEARGAPDSGMRLH